MLYNETLDVVPMDVISLIAIQSNVYKKDVIPMDVISLSAMQLNIYKKMCDSCTIYMVLFAVFFIISKCISSVFICFHWYLKRDNVSVKFKPGIQTTIY